MADYQAGQIVEGTVTGIQPYGAFVSLDEQNTGLIHISEISDGYVRDVGHFVHVGQTVRVKILDYDAVHHKARLSLKALHPSRPRRRRRNAVPRIALPPMRIGFASVASHMDQWIAEAERKMNDDHHEV